MKKTLILFIALFCLGLNGTVLAANTGDTNWDNEYRLWSPNDYTPSRKKDNGTAYYQKIKTLSKNLLYINAWAALSDGTDVSAGHTYKTYKGDVTFLYNLAHENHPGKKVRIDSQRFGNGSATGVWSPDSVK